jgi:DNA-3-methyladenine glycosylase II
VITEETITQAKKHFKKNDAVLGKIVDVVVLSEWRKNGNYFVDLVESIVSQQLSVKAADTIWKRFLGLFPDERVDPETVVSLPEQRIRDAGISWQKISYIKDLAKKTLESGIVFEQFEIMTDEEIINELVKVRGIGRWTAEMFLMFSMGRQDIFSYGDLGLRRAMQNLYALRKEPSSQRATQIANKWKPFRTIACRYLWASLDQKIAE